MSMSKEHSTQLWNAVQDSPFPEVFQTIYRANRLDDVASFNAINTKLLNAAAPLRHIPLRVYIPHQAEADTLGSFKIVQALVTPRTEKRECRYLEN
jgi:autophagy-related protein 5